MTVIPSDKYFIYENIYVRGTIIKCLDKERSTLLLLIVFFRRNELSLALLLLLRGALGGLLTGLTCG